MTQQMPEEILDLVPVPEKEICRGIYISKAPNSAVGETYLVRRHNDYFFVYRRTHADAFTVVSLPPRTLPGLEENPFGAELVFLPESGAVEARIPLTPQELVAYQTLIANLEAPSTLPPATAFQQAEQQLEELDQADLKEVPFGEPDPGLPGSKLDTLWNSWGTKTKAIAGKQMENSVDRALDVLEFVAERASKRTKFHQIRVQANINLGIGQVAIEVGVNKSESNETMEDIE